MPRAQVLTHDRNGVRVGWYSLRAPSRAEKVPPAKPGDKIDVSDDELARGVDLGLLVELDADGNPVGSSEADPMRDGAVVEARGDHAPEVAGSTPAPAPSDDDLTAEAPTGPMPDEPATSATPVETVEVAAEQPVQPAEPAEDHAPTARPGDDSTPEATEPAPSPAKPRRSGARRGGKRGS